MNKTYSPEEARQLVKTGRRGKAVCPHCGHPVAPDEIKDALRGKRREIYAIIARAGSLGISTPEIMEQVYGDRADGGPTWNVISAHVVLINRTLRERGLVIRSHRGWGQSCYRLLPLEAADET